MYGGQDENSLTPSYLPSDNDETQYYMELRKMPKAWWEIHGKIVAKGYNQRHGVVYEKKFCTVPRIGSIRLIISLEAENG